MDKDTKPRRKPYRKPQVERVDLVAEEQVLGGCKMEFDGGGAGLSGAGNCVTTPSTPCMYTAGT